MNKLESGFEIREHSFIYIVELSNISYKYDYFSIKKLECVNPQFFKN